MPVLNWQCLFRALSTSVLSAFVSAFFRAFFGSFFSAGIGAAGDQLRELLLDPVEPILHLLQPEARPPRTPW